MDSENFKQHLKKLYSVNNGKVKITNEIVKFTQNHSEPLHQVQKDLINYTNTNFESNSYMLTDGNQNQFFTLLLKVLNAKKAIDVGVYTGLSSLSFALSMPDDGKVTSIDCVRDYEECCHLHWKKANVDHKINLVIDNAKNHLQKLIDNGESGTFDFIFIDADKDSYDAYYELSLKLIRKGGIIAFDNILFFGATLVDHDSKKPEDQIFLGCPSFQRMVDALKLLNEKIANDERVIKTMLPLSDGITLVTKK
ncbi:O-methyltransferase family 3 protein [Dictyostelium discoideum AX4]|uniref:Probable caffeoyl-CoA O-methyltransferase 3 n=1 Tax=Dictyostelium discoideum TaxID=44689 RepID=CAMT3_DICDI|nr:O-methyltransferase family 3 protein [Dictyostelium discoideum AX4]Q55AS5.1 RecName: Full=Probable caffeoyl-CoA O-methyltransferase 3; AltName: Full=O-methyltransferase 1 [Dictyostelium discoideum]EAL71659.1 O-methyltransferase family 3 protein [Dictyostelium discoideum AX4]|eukprot:XP_645621.1 O-methyltransferase family 3 protein [Dictyostelium discoideum AX4]